MSTEPLCLADTGEWAGEWWLPEDPEHRVPGVLRYDAADELRLSLIGAFEDRIMAVTEGGVVIDQGSRTWGAIWGVAERREITLLGCLPSGSTRSFGARVKSPDKQAVEASLAVVGAHLHDEHARVFSRCEVSVENLGQWAASTVLGGTLGVRDGRLDGSGNVSVTPLAETSVEVDGARFMLGHRYTRPFFDERRGETVGRVRDTAFVRMEPSGPCSLREAFRFARLIQDLISLATHRAAGAIWLRLRALPEEATGVRPVSPRDVDVLYRNVVVGDHDARAVVADQLFFNCNDIPFEEIIPRWHGVHERLQAASNMILGLRYAPSQYVENNLLSAVGAAEVLHRGLNIDSTPIPKDQFNAFREAMLVQVPEEHRERIKAAVRNAPTLHDRLLALAGRPDADAIAQLVPDLDRWASVATRARNDLAHEGSTPRLSIEELVAVVDVTTAVVALNLLNELEVPPERQREIIHSHPQLRATAQRARECLTTPA
jgi:hypothetical protein